MARRARPLTSAVSHYQRQQRITAAGVAAAQRAYQQGNRRRLLSVITLFQFLAAKDSADSIDPILEEQGIEAIPVSAVVAASFAGIAPDGGPMSQFVDKIRDLTQLAMLISTVIQDAGRASGGVGIAARPTVTGYTRMLNPPSCSRCVILAGKWFKWNEGFERHPRCDCRHIPADEDVADDLITDPDVYFASLSRAEQDRTFTKAGAQAIRDGANMGQVVNARAGMRTAGISRTAEREIDGETFTVNLRHKTRIGDTTTAGVQRFGRKRLMPEAIYAIAGDDRDRAIALLRRWGYLL